MKSRLPWIFLFSFFLGVLTALYVEPARAATATHIVISEIKNSGSDEFIEFYNPTQTNISLNNWKVKKKTSAGSESNLISSMSGTIKSQGYFLVTSNESPSTASADMIYLSSVSEEGTVLLYDNNSQLVDKVGFIGSSDFEANPVTNPAVGKSIERKALTTSSALSMIGGGIDEFLGNGEDTDNNLSDFVTRDNPQPQNSQSETEIILTPTLTPTLTPSPTPTLEPSITLTPTTEPTSTPSDTPTPTITPTEEISPTITPTAEPSPTPTITPTPTAEITPTQTISPTLTPAETPTDTPTPVPQTTISPTITPKPIPSGDSFKLSCRTKIIVFSILRVKIQFPLLTCRIVRG